MKPHFTTFPLMAGALLSAASSLPAQDASVLNFIRETVSFRVTSPFAPNPNNIEIFPDYCTDFQQDPLAQGGPCGAVSPLGLAYEDFLGLLAQAHAQGRGGVIDFETPILGPALRDHDRTGHRAFIEQFIRDNPLEPFEAAVRAEFPGLPDNDVLILATNRQYAAGYAAAEAALLDTSARVPVVNRTDRGVDATADSPISESNAFDKLVGLYGPDLDVPLVIRRGPQNFVESMLATNLNPGAMDRATTNAQHYNTAGIGTYSGSAYRPVSGINSLNGGMLDLLFDPRDNVKALGFVFLTYGNFQYYQGESGVPVNPNNMRVWVEFSDGTIEQLAQTSQQSSGNWDVFFGIKAPQGASITRLWCRVIGRNWRTFVSIDDLAFITEPALSYVASATSLTGSQGAGFHEILQTGQNAQSVTVTGLPSGLSYNPANGLISGTFAAAGSHTATVRMVNAVGTSEEPLVFVVGPPLQPEEVLVLEPVSPAAVVLNRDLVPVQFDSSLDDDLPPGSITYFTLVEKILDTGDRAPTSLDFLGLTLRDNRIIGKPVSAQQIGVYEVRVFGRTTTSSATVTFELSVLAPTRSPNFDSNKTTDFAAVVGGTLLAADNPDQPGAFGLVPMRPRLEGIAAGARLFAGDFNGDNQTDFIQWDPAAGAVWLHASGAAGTRLTRTLLLDGVLPGSGEQIIAAADFNGDGTTDLLWANKARNRLSVWLMAGGRILWAGLLDKPAGVADLLFTGDFAGDARTMALWRRGPGAYALEQFTEFTSLGALRSTVVEFTLPAAWSPVAMADFTNDGRQDIVWFNSATGATTFWEMQGTSSNTAYLQTDDQGAVTANPGDPLLPAGMDWGVVAAIDLNNDQYADLVLRNRQTGALGLLYLRRAEALGGIVTVGDARHRLLAAGDFDGDAWTDLLLENTATGQVEIRSLPASGQLAVVPYASAPAGADWVTDLLIRPADPAAGADFDWLGGHTFLTNSWLHVFGFGFLKLTSGDATAGGWFLDPTLGYYWTSSAAFPWLYHGVLNYWIYYEPGSLNPRLIFFPGFGWLTEDEFIAFFL